MKLSHKECPQCSGNSFKELSPNEVQCEYCGSKFYLDTSNGSLKKKGFAGRIGSRKNNRTALIVIVIILGMGLVTAIISHNEKKEKRRRIERRYTVSGKLRKISSHKSSVPLGSLKGEFFMISEIPDVIGNVYFTGLYKNTGKGPLNKPKVTIVLYSPDGKKVASGYGYAIRRFLLPGEVTPVRILIRNPPRYSRYQVYDEPKPPYSFTRLERGNAAFENVRIEARRYSGYELRGSIVNKGSDVMRSIRLAIVLKDDEGKITGYGSQYVPTPPLGPGDDAPFHITVYRTFRKPVSWLIDYTCQVSGR